MVAPQNDQAAWMALVDEDIKTLKQAGVLPAAIALRLENAKYGVVQVKEWPNFRARGRGISHFHIVSGHPTVLLEFRHRAGAQQTLGELKTLQGQFKTIVGIAYREFGERDGASINIKLSPRPFKNEPDRARLAGQKGGK